MRVFVRSVIADFGSFRDAAGKAIADLGHEALRAETLGARDATPEQACLALERQADALVLLLGPRYGPIQANGLSATHEEYRDARDRAPVLVFVHVADGDPEPRQREFIAEARSWSSGRLTQSFATPDELRASITRQLHELELSRAAGPVDAAEIATRAVAVWAPSLSVLRSAAA